MRDGSCKKTIVVTREKFVSSLDYGIVHGELCKELITLRKHLSSENKQELYFYDSFTIRL